MHEFSIALSIVDICEEEAAKANAPFVEKIELEIGELAGIELDALEFAWDAAIRNTVLEKSEKIIHVVHGIAECMDCNMKFPASRRFIPCPSCNSMLTNVVAGKELKIKKLVMAKKSRHFSNMKM
jgi:hydrogenase nickel incorporation protein HypA/HybF